MSILRVDIGKNERAFVLVDEQPERYLVPGRHWLIQPFKKVRVERVNTEQPLAQLDPAYLALIPAADLQVVELGADERAILFHKGRPVRWLGRGLHQVWTVERLPSRDLTPAAPTVRVERVDVSGVATEPLRDEVRALVPASDYVETTAAEGSVALRYVDGDRKSVV